MRYRGSKQRLEDEGLHADYWEVTEERVLRDTEGAGYWKPGTVIERLHRGQSVYTRYSEYFAKEP